MPIPICIQSRPFSEAVAGVLAGAACAAITVLDPLVLLSDEVSVSLSLHAVCTGLHQAEEPGLRSSSVVLV